MSTVQVDKGLLKKLILKLGKTEAERSVHIWREIIQNPFNNILIGAFNIVKFGGKGDHYAFKTLYDLKYRIAKSNVSTIAEFIEKRINSRDLDELIKELGFAQELGKILEKLIDLNKRYNLDKKTDLCEIDANELYTELKDIEGFSEDGTILPWIICDLVRIWNLKVPKDLKLSEKVIKELEKLGLSPNDFDLKEYPYVDSAMFILSKDC